MQVETVVSHALRPEGFQGKGHSKAQIVLYFLSPLYAAPGAYLAALRKAYPAARLVGCTTGGEIFGDEALESTAVSVAIFLEKAHVKVVEGNVAMRDDSRATGHALASALQADDLKFIFVLSDGLIVSGSDLVQGMVSGCGADVMIAGGLAGDGTAFQKTGVGIDVLPQSGKVAAIGFYGDSLRIGCGSVGGWINFGPERVITKAQGNVLYELDGKSALELYKKYLGEEADKLPGSAVLFPLSISPPEDPTHSIVRTPFDIDHEQASLVFSDKIPQGYVARMMHGTRDNLVQGAAQAATYASAAVGPEFQPSLALLVSCVGRNMMMGQRISSEIAAVKELLGEMPIAGFYSYGEICPHPVTRKCDLHNQTMTITLLGEQP